jgi:hypothetical protein
VRPALIALLGERIDSLDIRRLFRGRRAHPMPREIKQTFWYRSTTWIIRHAVPAGLAVFALLVALRAPLLGVRNSTPDDRVLPVSAARAPRRRRQHISDGRQLCTAILRHLANTVGPATCRRPAHRSTRSAGGGRSNRARYRYRGHQATAHRADPDRGDPDSLSRVRECWVSSEQNRADNDESVVLGLAYTGHVDRLHHTDGPDARIAGLGFRPEPAAARTPSARPPAWATLRSRRNVRRSAYMAATVRVVPA